ncbi:hypothetical protein EYF80_010301 [Liparis tanakae]|uniref:Uncharacterized protein n=1 Tax=Liparis tanakae TaxID=230148 RepID=A0A4Z2INW9_9TELE|nr:hypothetical protein EYF80_010301 [Liparis tanakae]
MPVRGWPRGDPAILISLRPTSLPPPLMAPTCGGRLRPRLNLTSTTTTTTTTSLHGSQRMNPHHFETQRNRCSPGERDANPPSCRRPQHQRMFKSPAAESRHS